MCPELIHTSMSYYLFGFIARCSIVLHKTLNSSYSVNILLAQAQHKQFCKIIQYNILAKYSIYIERVSCLIISLETTSKNAAYEYRRPYYSTKLSRYVCDVIKLIIIFIITTTDGRHVEVDKGYFV